MTTIELGPWFRRAGLFAGAMMFWRFGALFFHANKGFHLANRSKPFERELADCRARVLVVGDSLAVGTGAHRAEESIAGLLGREFPDVAVINRARNGAKAADAVRQLRALPEHLRFDVVLVHVGGNDVLRATPLPQLEADLDEVFREARSRTGHVIFMTPPNVGLCPVFFPPFSWLLSMRSRHARDIFRRVSAEHGVACIDLFRERGEDVFSRNPRLYFADDRLHPTSESYRAAYHAICEGSQLRTILRAVEAEAEAQAHAVAHEAAAAANDSVAASVHVRPAANESVASFDVPAAA